MQDLIHARMLSACAAVLILFGCTGENTVDPAIEDAGDVFLINEHPSYDVEPFASKAFTGRDSFGIAMKARVTSSSSTSGSGNATHMGKITVVYDYADEGDTTTGTFRYDATNGSYLEGRFAAALESEDSTPPKDGDDVGVPTDRTVNGRLWIEGGHVEAAQKPAEGRGTIEGTLRADGSLDYKLDGWLLHHVREQEE